MSDLGSGRSGTVVAALLSIALNDAGRLVSIPASHRSVVEPAREAVLHWQVPVFLALSVPLNTYSDDQGAAVVAVLSSPGTHQKRQNVHSDQRASSRVYIRVRGIARPGLRVLTLTARHHAGQLPRSRGHVRVSYIVRNVGHVGHGADQVVTARTPVSAGHRGRPAAVGSCPSPGGQEPVTIDIGDVLATVFGKATDGITSRLFTDQPQHSVVTGTAGTRSQTVPWLLLSILLLLVAARVVRGRLRRRGRVGVHDAVGHATGRDRPPSLGPSSDPPTPFSTITTPSTSTTSLTPLTPLTLETLT